MSFVLRHSKIPWSKLIICSTRLLFYKLFITSGILVVDDTDRPRSKVTTKIAYVLKVFNKKTGGYIKAQNIVLLLLVTPIITIPVGFKFYTMCPKIAAWIKDDKSIRARKKAGEKDLKRTKQPERTAEHPTKNQIASQLVAEFKKQHPQIKVTCILGDAAFGAKDSVLNLEKVYDTPVISELRCNQKVYLNKNKKMSVKEYFMNKDPVKTEINIRDGDKKTVFILSARLNVSAQGRKLHVVALRYENEDTYRYLFCTDLTWRSTDIVRAYTYRWLIEVFFYDWKCYEGWGQTAMQRGETGAFCGLTLSLLLDQCLLLHPEQIRRIKANKPACTVGSLLEKIRLEDHLDTVRDILTSKDPCESLKRYAELMKGVCILRDSKKHLTGRVFKPLEPSESLAIKFKHCA